MKKFSLILVAVCLCIVPMMGSSDDSYHISMLPRHSPSEIMKRIKPLAACLSDRIHHSVVPVVERNYAEYERQVISGNIHIGYENPVVYVQVSGQHEVLAMALDKDGKDMFRGLIIVRKDSKIKTISDLKGKEICVVGKTSAGGYLSPKLFLQEQGINVEEICEVTEAVDNKQENVIFSVFTGEADAGFIKESALHMADTYIPGEQIRVLAEGAWLPNYALSVDRSMPEVVKKAIQDTLVELKGTDPVLYALKISGFRKAVDTDYDIVRKALTNN